MKSVNKILILFGLIIMLSFVVTWEVLQSRWIASNVSEIVTDYVNEKYNGEIEFSNFTFKLFPPGAQVNDVKFRGNVEGVEIETQVQTAGIYFSPWDVFETQFIVDEVLLADGYITIKSKKEKSSPSNKKSLDIDNEKNFEIMKKIPVNNLNLKDLSLTYDKYAIDINTLAVENRKYQLRLRGKVENIEIDKYSKYARMVDSIDADLFIDKYELKLNTFKVYSSYISMNASGEVSSYLSENVKYNLKVSADMPINLVNNFYDLSQVGNLDEGKLRVDGQLKGEGSSFSSKLDLSLLNFKTDFCYGDELTSTVAITNKGIEVENLKLMAGNQKIVLQSGFELYNFTSRAILPDSIKVSAQRVQLNNILRYLRKDVGFLSGEITTKVEFKLRENSFDIRSLEESEIHNFQIKVGDDLKIVSIEDFQMESAYFNVNDGVFKMATKLISGDTSLSVNGYVSKDKVDFKIPVGFVELEKFGKIVGFDFTGNGILDLGLTKVDNKFDLNAKLNLSKFSFENYKLDKIRANLMLDLESNRLTLNNLQGISSGAIINADAAINLDDLSIDASYAASKMTMSGIKKILDPLIGTINLSNKEINGEWGVKGNIKGQLSDLDAMIIEGELDSTSIYVFEENLEHFKSKFLLKDSTISVSKLYAEKFKGVVLGSINFDIPTESLEYQLELKSIPIQESYYVSHLPLNMRGKLSGVWNGALRGGDLVNQFKFKLDKTFVNNKEYEDTYLSGTMTGKSSEISMNLFGKKVRMKSKVDLNEKTSKDSFIDFKADIPDIREFVALFKGVDLLNNNVSGRVDYDLNFKFDPLKFQISDYYSNMKWLKLSNGVVDVDYRNNLPEIVVEKGVIKKWDTNIRGRRFYIISRAEGNVYDEFTSKTQMKIDASILEVFNNVIAKASGNLRSKLIFGNKAGERKYNVELTSSNLSLRTTYFPTELANGDIKIVYKDGNILLDKFRAQLSSGEVELGGVVNVSSLIPDVNLRYKFKDAGVNILKKSNLVFSGNGSVVGKTFPYTVGGDFQIQKLLILNEVTDFMKGRGSINSTDISFLPESEQTKAEQIVNLNLNVVTREPIFIRNSLADLGFTGNIQVIGGERDPRIIGKMDLAPRVNKVTFKNNEYLFSRGNILFVDRNKYTNPVLDFIVTSEINNYKINMKLFGPVKNYNLEFASEPSLSQSDILSLIAFGYTEDISNNLSDSEKESMTRAGVGSIVFDSFKINETLKNEFGIQVNLGTSISQQQGSYLAGRSAEGASNLSRVNSATTFEIKKKLNEAMSLSVSSTVGDATTQRQSMNLNYNINNKVSVEGVYESRSINDAEAINIDSSFGADLKLRWSFK